MRKYLADTSALIVFSTVAGSFVEIVVAGLTVEQSLRARLTAIPVILITGRPYGVYRDWFWRITGAESGGAGRRVLADTTAFATFQLPIYWAVLAFAGATISQIVAASVSGIVVLVVSGRPYGALLDRFRMLYGAASRPTAHAPDRARPRP